MSRKKIIKSVCAFAVAAAVIVLLYFSFAGNASASKTAFCMDTSVTVTVTGKNSEKTASLAIEKIKELENSCFSKTAEGSDIYNINRDSSARISKETLNVLVTALDICKKSEGALDIGIGSLVDLWGVTSGRKLPPEESEIAAASGSRFADIKIEGDTVSVSNKAKIDLGSVGKGAACDSIKEILSASGCKRAVAAVGGSVLFYGDGSFTAGIADPNKGPSAYIAELTTKACCISTSGTYERYFDYNGRRYHHILDPKTGYPVSNGLVSVTVISQSGLVSDALSTACFVLGIEKGRKLCEKFGSDAVFIDDNNKIYTCGIAQTSVRITDSAYSFA